MTTIDIHSESDVPTSAEISLNVVAIWEMLASSTLCLNHHTANIRPAIVLNYTTHRLIRNRGLRRGAVNKQANTCNFISLLVL